MSDLELVRMQVAAIAAELQELRKFVEGMANVPNRTTGLIQQHAGPRLRGGRRSYND